MRVPVMLVVCVRVCMGHWFVKMLVLVALGQVQPHPRRHESASKDKLNCDRLSERNHRHCAPEKRCRRKVCAGTRRPKMPQSDDEEREAHPVPEEADNSGDNDRRDTWDGGADRERENDIEWTRDKALQLDDL